MQTLSNELHDALVKQAHLEFQSSILYLHYAYWFDAQNYSGIGNFFKGESEDERKHAIQIFDFLNVRGYEVKIDPSLLQYEANDKLQFQKPGEVFELYHARETFNFKQLNYIAQLAIKSDAIEPLTQKFVNHMLQEQVDACDKCEKILAKSKAYSAVPGLYFHLDHELNDKGQNFDTWKF